MAHLDLQPLSLLYKFPRWKHLAKKCFHHLLERVMGIRLLWHHHLSRVRQPLPKNYEALAVVKETVTTVLNGPADLGAQNPLLLDLEHEALVLTVAQVPAVNEDVRDEIGLKPMAKKADARVMQTPLQGQNVAIESHVVSDEIVSLAVVLVIRIGRETLNGVKGISLVTGTVSATKGNGVNESRIVIVIVIENAKRTDIVKTGIVEMRENVKKNGTENERVLGPARSQMALAPHLYLRDRMIHEVVHPQGMLILMTCLVNDEGLQTMMYVLFVEKAKRSLRL